MIINHVSIIGQCGLQKTIYAQLIMVRVPNNNSLKNNSLNNNSLNNNSLIY